MLEPRSQAMVRGVLGRSDQKDRDDEAPVGKLTGQDRSLCTLGGLSCQPSRPGLRTEASPEAHSRPKAYHSCWPPSQDFLPSPGGTAQDEAHTRYRLCLGAQPGQVCVHVSTGQRGAAFGLPSDRAKSSYLNSALGSVFSGARAASLHSCHTWTSLAWHRTSTASSLVSSVPFPPQSFVNEA